MKGISKEDYWKKREKRNDKRTSEVVLAQLGETGDGGHVDDSRHVSVVDGLSSRVASPSKLLEEREECH